MAPSKRKVQKPAFDLKKLDIVGNFQCPNCDNTFIQGNCQKMNLLLYHLHGCNTRFMCYVCDFHGINKSELKYHLENVHRLMKTEATCQKQPRKQAREKNEDNVENKQVAKKLKLEPEALGETESEPDAKNLDKSNEFSSEDDSDEADEMAKRAKIDMAKREQRVFKFYNDDQDKIKEEMEDLIKKWDLWLPSLKKVEWFKSLEENKDGLIKKMSKRIKKLKRFEAMGLGNSSQLEDLAASTVSTSSSQNAAMNIDKAMSPNDDIFDRPSPISGMFHSSRKDSVESFNSFNEDMNSSLEIDELKYYKKLNCDDIDKNSISKHVNALKKYQKLKEGPDISDSFSRPSKYNLHQECEREATKKYHKQIEKYFKKGQIGKHLMTYEEKVIDDAEHRYPDNEPITANNLLMKIELLKSLMSPWQRLKAEEFSELIDNFEKFEGRKSVKLLGKVHIRYPK